MPAFSRFFLHLFKRPISQGRENQKLFGKGSVHSDWSRLKSFAKSILSIAEMMVFVHVKVHKTLWEKEKMLAIKIL